MGVLKVRGDDEGSRLIIMDCMAQYCNYWRKRKSPIDGNVIVDVSRLVGGRGEEWKTSWMGWWGSDDYPRRGMYLTRRNTGSNSTRITLTDIIFLTR